MANNKKKKKNIFKRIFNVFRSRKNNRTRMVNDNNTSQKFNNRNMNINDFNNSIDNIPTDNISQSKNNNFAQELFYKKNPKTKSRTNKKDQINKFGMDFFNRKRINICKQYNNNYINSIDIFEDKFDDKPLTEVLNLKKNNVIKVLMDNIDRTKAIIDDAILLAGHYRYFINDLSNYKKYDKNDLDIISNYYESKLSSLDTYINVVKNNKEIYEKELESIDEKYYDGYKIPKDFYNMKNKENEIKDFISSNIDFNELEKTHKKRLNTVSELSKLKKDELIEIYKNYISTLRNFIYSDMKISKDKKELWDTISNIKRKLKPIKELYENDMVEQIKNFDIYELKFNIEVLEKSVKEVEKVYEIIEPDNSKKESENFLLDGPSMSSISTLNFERSFSDKSTLDSEGSWSDDSTLNNPSISSDTRKGKESYLNKEYEGDTREYYMALIDFAEGKLENTKFSLSRNQ